MPHTVRRFESVGAFADAAETPTKTNMDGYGDESLASRGYPTDWNGGITWDDSLRLAREGWSEEHSTLSGMLSGLVTTIEETLDVVWQPVYSVEGGAIDVERFLLGEPESMVMFIPSEASTHTQVVKVLISTGVLAQVDPAMIRMRGLAVCCLVELIGRSGKAVELWGESTATGAHNHRHTTLVKIKAAESNLDLDQVMFALVHPAWHRRLVFSIREQEAVNVRKALHAGGGYSRGYGSTCEPEMADTVGASVVIPTLNSYDRDFRTVEGAVAWIGKQLTNLGLARKEG